MFVIKCKGVEEVLPLFYKEMKKGWHYFYMARVTSCPVVLTENGFISNPDDFAGIIDESTNTKKAEKITQGVLNYFNSFYKNVANDGDNSYNDDNIGLEFYNKYYDFVYLFHYYST